MPDWNNCEHEWQVEMDSQFHSEVETSVKCVKCGCHGARDNKTGQIFWPAT